MTLESFEAQVNIENDTDCHEQYQSDDSDSENEAHESEKETNEISSEIVTTAQFVNLQSRGASEQVYNFLHELDNIALHGKLNSEVSLQKKNDTFL